ncbi:MAG: class II fructose-bisphosphate aldolase [Kiritimatiellae bacterium]|nr:class II fructose-bisphosphate aldolase [Kiritimatiellia bacterium]MBQ3344001.1 class II fructose-bisphosphate aldolase [Kiritimatiellia bacterium]
MLVNMKGVLADAAKGGYAVGGFNFASLESGMGAVRASEELAVPFVLEHAPAHEEYCPFDVAAPIMLQLAKAAKTPVVAHLDHGDSVELCLKALRLGFSSVMFDGSALSYEENIEKTAFVCKVAHEFGATVEAELGAMPHNLKGELREYTPEDFYTRPEEAARFVAETGVDALAISFGTVHGVYKAEPKLAFGVIDEVRKATGDIPLVMHGGSGLSNADYRQAISRGIRKVNYYTYGAIAAGEAVREYVADHEGKLMFHDIAVCATDAVCADVKRVMRILKPEVS